MVIRNPRLIEDMFRSCVSELEELKGRSELSSYLDMNQLLTKSLLLSCASFYEAEIMSTVRYVLKSGRLNESVADFLDRSAVEGQFYKWFNFRSSKNTNPFLSRFGPDFKDKMRAVIDSKEARKMAEVHFLELCKKRNESVHRNYAAYSLDFTLDEIHQKHKSAMAYIRVVRYGAEKWLTSA